MRTELSLVKPTGNRCLKNPAAEPAPASNNQNAPLAARARRSDEAEEHTMRLVLCHSVQVKPRVNPVLAAFQPRRIGAIDAAESIECDRMRRRVSARNSAWNGQPLLRERLRSESRTRRQRLDVACFPLP